MADSILFYELHQELGDFTGALMKARYLTADIHSFEKKFYMMVNRRGSVNV